VWKMAEATAGGSKGGLKNWRSRKTDEKGWSSSDLDDFESNDGNEVCYNLNEKDTIMGQLFYEKWRKANTESMRISSGEKEILTNIKMFGRYYPCNIRLVEGTSPPTLGKSFFARYGWQIDEEENITSLQGKIITKPGRGSNREIDSEETENVYKCESIFKEGLKPKYVIQRLHKYFGHVSPESLYRILKASSGRDKFKQEEIRKVCENCPSCATNKRKMNRKKTSLPRAMAFNQVVTLDLKVHGTSEYILWCVDDATRFIRGEVIRDKKPETIRNTVTLFQCYHVPSTRMTAPSTWSSLWFMDTICILGHDRHSHVFTERMSLSLADLA